MNYQISTKEFENYKPISQKQTKSKNWVRRAKAELIFWASAFVLANASLLAVIGFAIKLIFFPNV